MSNRSVALALATIAVIGTAALTSTSAFALRLSGPGTPHVGPTLTHVIPGSFASSPHFTPVTPHLTPVTPVLPPAVHLTPTLPPAVHLTPPTLPPAVHLDPDHDHDWHHHDHDWRFWWHQPRFGAVAYGEVGYTAIGSVGTQAAAPCNCLTKRYLDDGSVLFSDVCTKEQAMATPAQLQQQAQGTP